MRVSITTKGFIPKKISPHTSLSGAILRKILLIKCSEPRKLAAIRSLKRANVGRKRLKPRNERGTVKTSQTGP
jgi:hypothetical protein